MPRRKNPYRTIKRWSQIAWQTQPDGSASAVPQSDKAGEVLFVIRQRRTGLTAAAYGFLGTLLWESQERKSAYSIRRAARRWWESVTDGPTRTLPAVPVTPIGGFQVPHRKAVPRTSAAPAPAPTRPF